MALGSVYVEPVAFLPERDKAENCKSDLCMRNTLQTMRSPCLTLFLWILSCVVSGEIVPAKQGPPLRQALGGTSFDNLFARDTDHTCSSEGPSCRNSPSIILNDDSDQFYRGRLLLSRRNVLYFRMCMARLDMLWVVTDARWR